MRIIRFLAVCSLSLWAMADNGAFGQSCPAHAHVTGTTQEGNVRTIHCGCDVGYVNVDGRCASRAACISDAGYQLEFALSDCAANKPSIVSFACLQGTGITAKSLACLQGLPDPRANKSVALAKCGMAAMVPLDAASRCQGIDDQCIVAALQTHKSRVAFCQK